MTLPGVRSMRQQTGGVTHVLLCVQLCRMSD
jgi:hypothetical protein